MQGTIEEQILLALEVTNTLLELLVKVNIAMLEDHGSFVDFSKKLEQIHDIRWGTHRLADERVTVKERNT